MKPKVKSIDIVTTRFRNSLFYGGILFVFTMMRTQIVRQMFRGQIDPSDLVITDCIMAVAQLLSLIMIISSVFFYIAKKRNDKEIGRLKNEGNIMQMQVAEVIKVSKGRYRIKAVFTFASPDLNDYYLSPVTKDEAIAKLKVGTPISVYIDPNDERNYYLDIHSFGSFI